MTPRWPPWPAPRARPSGPPACASRTPSRRRPTTRTSRAYLQAKANAEAARLNLEFCQIRSPIDGKTGPILLQPGNLVSVNGLTAPLVTITQIQPIKISFFLPQTDLPRIEARQKAGGLVATVDQSDTGGSSFSVPVDFVSNAVNATSGTIELRATYDNKDSRWCRASWSM